MQSDAGMNLNSRARRPVPVVVHVCALAIFVMPVAALGDSIGIESRTVSVGGTIAHYLLTGPPNGLPVVLLHGGRFNAQTWVETGTLAALVSHGYRAIAVDLPGFGESKPSTMEPGEWLDKFLTAIKVDRPVIVSPSMSGRFALPFITKHTKRFRGFVAVAPVGIKEHQRDLRRVTVPVLAIWGEQDGIVPLGDADLLIKQVSNGKRVVVPGAGHALYMDDIKAFHSALFEFLDDVKRAKRGG